MKVLQIRMQQFGPYVDEVIDFTELNEQRLFLLEGKTGSGKSTIIEGIVFALFGKDSKGRDEDVRRISAPADQNATVTLEFEVEGCLYRVVRSPMWQKEGVKTKKLQSVTLAEIDADGNVCVSILREDYSPVLSLNHFVQSLLFILYCPNMSDPLEEHIAILYQTDSKKFTRNVKKTLQGKVVDGVAYTRVIP